MILILIYQFFILLILNKNIGNAITINAIAYSHHVEGQIYTPLVNEFNKYSKENNLGIKLNINLLTLANATFDVGGYKNTLQTLLQKKSNKYDLYFYDNIYAKAFSHYLLDIKSYLPEEHINLYSKGIAAQTSVFNNKWVGLPVSIEYTVLYGNKELLDKYQKGFPKTWDELIDTTNYILNEEKKLNNTDLIGYNGLFPYKELGMCSLYEFIYSFRNSSNSSFPSMQSQEVINALNMMKKIKNEISSDNIFQSDDTLTKNLLNNNNFVFLKYWYMPSNKISKSILPGVEEGISATSIGGYNIGIGNFVEGDKKKAAIEAFRYMTSKEVQKKYIIKKGLFSGIPDLYEDEEVCEAIDCEFFKSFQPIARPTYITNDYDTYSEKFRTIIYEFLYHDQPIQKVLQLITDIVNIFYITFSTKTTSSGLIYLILTSTLTILMIISIFLIFIEKFKSNYQFLSNDLWIIVILSCVIIMNVGYVEMGETTIVKCKLKPIVLFIGFSLYNLPFLYKLIENFTFENVISEWIKRHKTLFIVLYIVPVIIFIILSYSLTSYNLEVKMIKNGKNIKVCTIDNDMGYVTYYLLLAFVICIGLIILALGFLEWNILDTFYDIRFLVTSIYVDFVLFGIFISLKIIDFENYITYFILKASIFILISVSNYILSYGIRFFWERLIELFKDSLDINNSDLFVNFDTKSERKDSISNYSICSNSSKSSKLEKYIIRSHYRGSISSASEKRS